MRSLDHITPGPAGLYRDPSRLTASGWQQEMAARARLERWCHFCGQPSTYGFGETLHTDGVLTCADADCMRQGEAEAAERDRAVRVAVEVVPAHPEPPVEPIMDLFGAAA